VSRPSLTYPLNIATSLMATALRTGMGIITSPAVHQPAQLLELYEFEGCPHCRLVREVLTELDLDAQIYPCPKGGERYRAKVLEMGGKTQFPYFVDPNTSSAMYESADIIKYLFTTYGSGSVPVQWKLLELQRFGSTLASIPRMGQGISVRPSRKPEQALELYSFESSPFARPVRDVLCELELPYVLHSVGRSRGSDWVPPMFRDALSVTSEPGTRNRQRLLERAGRISIPYLVDPNTGSEMAESADIVAYLNTTYSQS
jgi:glutathione S-transferase